MPVKPIQTLSSRIVYQNKWACVREDIILRESGQEGLYGILDKDPACIVIPLEQTADGDLSHARPSVPLPRGRQLL